jgi:actin-related protein 4
MLSNINIIGGGSCFGRFTERLQAELQGLDLYGLYNRLKIYSPENEEKVNANWLGGSILGSMPESEKWVVTKKEYDEQGPSCLDRKLA